MIVPRVLEIAFRVMLFSIAVMFTLGFWIAAFFLAKMGWMLMVG